MSLGILNAQNLSIQAVMPKDIKLPSEATSALMSKMQRLCSQNGYGSSSSPFILTTSVNIVDKKVTATAPAQYVVNLEVEMYIVNLSENLLIGTVNFPLNSIDISENKAIIRAINRLNVNSVQARRFMEISRAKIVDYYSIRVPETITKAESLVKQKKYDEALLVLANVPDEIEGYSEVLAKMNEIYTDISQNDTSLESYLQSLSETKFNDSKANTVIQNNLSSWIKTVVR